MAANCPRQYGLNETEQNHAEYRVLMAWMTFFSLSALVGAAGMPMDYLGMKVEKLCELLISTASGEIDLKDNYWTL